jgi:hypothetical protein
LIEPTNFHVLRGAQTDLIIAAAMKCAPADARRYVE